MGKTNFRRMMMLRDHDKDREPERDRLEEERDRRERELERRLRKLEDGNDRYPYYPQEENRYIDPYPIPRYPDVEYGRKMPQIGFSQNGDWEKRSGQYEHGGADSRSIKMPRKHLTHDEAEEWCDSMVNADGTKGLSLDAGTDTGRCQTAQHHLRPERFLGCHEHDVLGLLSSRKAPVR